MVLDASIHKETIPLVRFGGQGRDGGVSADVLFYIGISIGGSATSRWGGSVWPPHKKFFFGDFKRVLRRVFETMTAEKVKRCVWGSVGCV